MYDIYTEENYIYIVDRAKELICLGAPLALLEAKIAIEVMLERLAGMRRVTEVPLEASESFILNGVKHLPITFERSR